jgi:Glycosyltransferase Family 4
MRIAVLCSDLGIRIPGPKGASLHLTAITRALAAVGHEVLLIGVAGHGPPPDIGVEYVLLPHPGRTTGLRRELRKIAFCEELPAGLRDSLRRFAPQMLYERLSLFGTAGAAIAQEFDIPHVVEVNALLSREDSAWRGLHLSTLAVDRERACSPGPMCVLP